MTAYVLDDEPLAVRRLERLLAERGSIDLVGTSVDPAAAVEDIRRLRPDVLFLDIEMPVLSGFDVLERVGPPQPFVVFTTAYPEYALEAFTVDTIDYLVKPIEPEALERALAKLDRVTRGGARAPDLTQLVGQLRALVASSGRSELSRIASRTGGRVEFFAVADVAYFYAKDKLTFAVIAGRHHALDSSLTDLEQRLPPQRWIRIHRATLLNLDAVKELRSCFGERLLLRLKDGTELRVARDRAAEVRTRLGL
jgi:two-component system LytT family response regulator